MNRTIMIRSHSQRILRTAFLTGALGGFPFVANSYAELGSAAKLQQVRTQLAQMGERGAMGGKADGQMGGGQSSGSMGGGQMGRGQMGSGQMGGAPVDSAPMGGMMMPMDGMMRMDGMMDGMMGRAPGAGTSMTMPSVLPGFPGASHLYHVGASGFFLDYADKLNLSVEQRTSLNGVKQRALLEQSGAQRKADEAEQALWILTAADQPDAAAIEVKVREIEKLKSDQRLAFIRAVGEAAKVLTADQQKMVLGMAPMTSGAPAKTMTK